MLWSRIKSWMGTREKGIPTRAAAAALVLPEDSNTVLMTGTDTVTSVNGTTPIEAGRMVLFVGSSGTTTFTNTDGTSTKGQMDLGGSNVALAAADVLCIQQRADGSWVRIFSTDN